MNLNHVNFLNKLIAKLEDLGIDISDAKLDHIAYQASSNKDYDKLKPQLLKIAELVKEPLVNGRRVGVFKFFTAVKYKDQNINVIELVEPKKDQKVSSGLEHAEFLLPITLEKFMGKYPDIEWDTKSLNREEFPMLILKLSSSMRAKFPRYPILSSN